MGENSGIEWTDHTFNPWIGCTRVSPACDHCYAESYAKRYGKAEWGVGKARQLTSESNWKQPLKWDREAMTTGVRRRVFCASLADVFDNEVEPAWRDRLWELIRLTPNLDWLLLTKRIGNVPKMLPPNWGDGWHNVWLGITVANQQEADRDIPKLLAAPACVRFLSMEPLLGPVDLTEINGEPVLNPECWGDCRCDSLYGRDPGCKRQGGDGVLCRKIDWVIVGGESGPNARPMHPEWARSLRDQCVAAGVSFLFKQWGEYAEGVVAPFRDTVCFDPEGNHYVSSQPETWQQMTLMHRVGKKAAGRLLDGGEWNELPASPAACKGSAA